MFSSFNFSNLSSVVVFLLVTIPALYKLIKPLIEAKITTEKNAHIKQHMEVGLKIVIEFVKWKHLRLLALKKNRAGFPD